MRRASCLRPGAACFLLLLAALLLAACAPASADPRPPEILYGLDMCDGCGMLISEPRFAAATLLADGGTRKFDDVGDMLAYHRSHPEVQVRAYFVHDYHSEAWVRGEAAYYVVSRNIRTPMGHGIAAFEERAAAEALAASLGGRVLTLDELRAEVRAAHGN